MGSSPSEVKRPWLLVKRNRILVCLCGVLHFDIPREHYKNKHDIILRRNTSIKLKEIVADYLHQNLHFIFMPHGGCEMLVL